MESASRAITMTSRVLIVAAGMIVFASFWHQGGAWSVAAAAGLLVAAVGVARTPSSVDRAPRAPAATLLGVTALGIALGAGLATWHRQTLGLPAWPSADVQAFVIVACLVGVMEELLFRGWMIGQTRALGWPAAVVFTAVAHGAYKTALFAWPAGMSISLELWWLMLVTTIAGLALGLLRVWSNSVAPAAAAHAAFDFVVYAGVATAPWWVWG
jgi:membrane protease YdiL (CAAX protease family)